MHRLRGEHCGPTPRHLGPSWLASFIDPGRTPDAASAGYRGRGLADSGHTSGDQRRPAGRSPGRDLRGALRYPAASGEPHRSWPWPVYGVRSVSPMSGQLPTGHWSSGSCQELPAAGWHHPMSSCSSGNSPRWLGCWRRYSSWLAGDSTILPSHLQVLAEYATEHHHIVATLLAAQGNAS